MKIILTAIIALLLSTEKSNGQANYTAQLKKFQADYVSNHEVVTGKDKNYFRFFNVDSLYHIKASFERISDSIGFTMKTSGAVTKHYYRYGKISFILRDSLLHLTMYQSKDLMTNDQYKDYLMIAFTDLTTGDESYGSGRYLDFMIADIQNNSLTIDFNKAYNPYCAYATGFNCPLPPKENNLGASIMAGEKAFGKMGH
jgi:uncharacterized protein